MRTVQENGRVRRLSSHDFRARAHGIRYLSTIFLLFNPSASQTLHEGE
jgi:hypothetical protein